MNIDHLPKDEPSQGRSSGDQDGTGSTSTSNHEREVPIDTLKSTDKPVRTIAIDATHASAEDTTSAAKRHKSDRDKGRKPKRQYATNWKINWQELTDNLQALQNLHSTAYQPVPYRKVDELVGWATHTIRSTLNLNSEDVPNPFLGLPSTPLPPSILYFIQDETARIIANDRKSNFHLLRNGFDQSALVSLGMIIEESITASLLPMARKHVQRCMEQSTRKPQNRKSAMKQWTAAPEDCILQIIQKQQKHDREPILPSLLPPVLSTMIGQPDYVPAHRSLIHDSSAESALQQWADSQDLSVPFIKKNHKLFGLDRPRKEKTKPKDAKEDSGKKRKIVAV